MSLLRRFVRDDRGEDLVEYGLLAAFVAGVALALLGNAMLRGALSQAFATVGNLLITM